MKRLLLTILIILGSNFILNCQDLVSGRKSSYYSYIYQITNTEAYKLYKNDQAQIDSSYFHTVYDSFPSQKSYEKYIPFGHYIYVSANKDMLQIHLESFYQTDLKILQSEKFLDLIVLDSLGDLVKDAKVKLNNRAVRFDKNSNTYKRTKGKKTGFLQVHFNGINHYYSLKDGNSSSKKKITLRRFKNKLLFNTPIRYISKPIYSIVQLIRWGTPPRFIEKIINKFNYGFKDRFRGYMVFNKPKYKPGDTVKVKAFIVKNKSNKPINRPLKVILKSRDYSKKRIYLDTIRPYRKGGYKYEFVLHDSLDLTLDYAVNVAFAKKSYSEYIKSQFDYEYYELKSTDYKIRTEKEEHRKGEPMALYLKGTDENDLNLLDAKFDITITPKVTQDFPGELVFISDTLWEYEQKLDPVGETKVVLPDSIFPDARLRYNVKIAFTNSDNELVIKEKELDYFYDKKELRIEIKQDSLFVDLYVSGKKSEGKAIFNCRNNYLYAIHKNIRLPYKSILDPKLDYYHISNEETSTELDLSDRLIMDSQHYRTKDSVFIAVENPKKVDFWFTILNGKEQVIKGFTNKLKFKEKSRGVQPYYLLLEYMWGGELKKQTFSIPFYDKQLRLSFDQPEVINPGQEAEITINVKDVTGKPVPGVDLTAYAYTKKFKESSKTEVPYMGKSYYEKNFYNSLKIENDDSRNYNSLGFDADNWGPKMGLDSLEFYNFLFPKDSIYRYNIATPDSSTQFAPFLFVNGVLHKAEVIYLDEIPVYYNRTNTLRRYSFHVAPDRLHYIKIRTADTLVELSNIKFKEGYKNILSVSNICKAENIDFTKMTSYFSPSEIEYLNRYLTVISNDHKSNFVYLKQGKKIHLINNTFSRTKELVVGPISPINSKFKVLDFFTQDFIHEPGYTYYFRSGLIKMKENKFTINKILNNKNSHLNISQIYEFAFTEKEIKEKWNAHLELLRSEKSKYDNPLMTTYNHGKLNYELEDTVNQTPYKIKNIVLLKEDNPNFIRVYKGTKFNMHQLEKGKFKLLFLLNGNKHFEKGNINIKVNGVNYLKVVNPKILENDNHIDSINQIIGEGVFDAKTDRHEIKYELSQIRDISYNKYSGNTYSGIFNNVTTGVVTDDMGEPLPGVSVVIKGTSSGTVTNIDGKYKLYVPSEKYELVFSFIGYRTQEISSGAGSGINVQLDSDTEILEEVVVTAVGFRTEKRSAGYSTSTISSLNGKMAGVNVTSAFGEPGSSTSIFIRGNTSLSGLNNPLIIVNGVPYTGKREDIKPDDILSVNILKGATATALYGVRAKNGAIIINTKNNPTKNSITQNNSPFFAQDISNSIRSNFSDYAFWQPDLISDSDGKATFRVKFPDDVTNWKTYAIGINNKKQSGEAEGEIKSYKSLMARLAVPHFLVEGDSANVIGKILNYTLDTLNVKSTLKINDKTKHESTRKLVNSIIDTTSVTALNRDSLKIEYFIKHPNGYLDGEKREIPVYKKGVLETEGEFKVLEKDSTFHLKFENKKGDIEVYANANSVDIMLDEIKHVRNYFYMCNEQMASKIKMLLSEKEIKEAQGEKWNRTHVVKKLVKKLERNKNRNGLWGWWLNSHDQLWISKHVVESLIEAKKHGFKISINYNKLVDFLIWEVESAKTKGKLNNLILLNKIISEFKARNVNLNFKKYIKMIEKDSLNLNQSLKLLNLKADLQLDFNLDSIWANKQETIFGSYYWGEKRYHLHDNAIINTLLVYQILKKKGGYEKELARIRAYFFERRKSGYWRNTYESSLIVKTILTDILTGKNKALPPKLTIQGRDKPIISFPYKDKFKAIDEISFTNNGDVPIFITAYQKSWNINPHPVEKDLIVKTYFKQNNLKATYLKGGKPTELIVELEVKKDADYVMLDIPIPAGCSYQNKRKARGIEIHREYYYHKTNIFCEKLSKGHYTFKIDLVPRYSGNYNINPAKAELMYYPVFYGRNEMKKIDIR